MTSVIRLHSQVTLGLGTKTVLLGNDRGFGSNKLAYVQYRM